MTLPKGFLIGAATAAHQVEGNNIHSDYWAQENMEFSSFAEPSGDTCDHYHRYEEDIKLLANAGLNAYRFSIEWARIEPEEGKFDEAQIEHYRQVLKCCRDNGVEPVVTFLHFTSPKWLIQQGGWEAPETVEKFARYCRFVAERLGDWMGYVCTINEANMGLQLAAISERYKKMMTQNAAKAQGQVESSIQVGVNLENPMLERMKKQAMENVKIFGTPQPQTFVSSRTPEGDILVMKAHQAAKAAIKEVKPNLKVGLTLSLHDIQPVDGGEGRAAAEWDEEFTHYLSYIRDDDFFGLQNYTRTLMGPDGQRPNPEGEEVTQMGYEYYPQALENVIRKVHEYLNIPIIVTENGIATPDDTRRVAFIETAMAGIEHCVADGIPVKGYFYWSLMDNFEWQKGFTMQFGLISVDRKTQTRFPKKSLTYLGNWR